MNLLRRYMAFRDRRIDEQIARLRERQFRLQVELYLLDLQLLKNLIEDPRRSTP